MYKQLCLFTAIAWSLIVSPEKSFSQTTFYHKYVIEFTDKINSPYSVNDPSAYLSQRAIDRRNRYNIPIRENDLPINPSYIQQVTATGVKLLNKSKWLNSISIETDDSLALVAIGNLSFVKSSNAVALRKEASSVIQKKKWSEPEQRLSSTNSFDYGNAFHQIDMMKGEVLHERNLRGQGMQIAIFDAGYYNCNPDSLDIFDSLFDDNRILGTWNFVHGTDSVFQYATHGTEVLSSIVANKPGFEIGTAPLVSVYLYVTEDATSEYPIEEHNWAAAAEVADSIGADMISSSLGYSTFDDPVFDHTYADMDGKTTTCSRAATIAAGKGMIVCSSAGNEGQHPWFYITAPADADSILTVGSTDSAEVFTTFSSHGPTSDGRIKPNIVAQGSRVWVIDPAAWHHTIFPGSGTSFSNPIAAGLVACLWQAHQDKNNIQIISAIEQSASRYFNPDDSFGYGIPNFEVADLILKGETPNDLNITHPIVYPNPFSDVAGILYYETAQQAVQIRIFDMTGRLFTAFHYTLQPGYNYLPVDMMQNAANGSYFLRVNFDDHVDVLRLVKEQH